MVNRRSVIASLSTSSTVSAFFVALVEGRARFLGTCSSLMGVKAPAQPRQPHPQPRRPSDRYLFSVGDDWQFINRFASADLSVMTRFHD